MFLRFFAIFIFCFPDCGQLNINYGIHADNIYTTYDSTITVTCEPGYSLYGESSVSCLESGYWSDIPVCNLRSKFSKTSLHNNYVSCAKCGEYISSCDRYFQTVLLIALTNVPFYISYTTNVQC